MIGYTAAASFKNDIIIFVEKWW